MPKPSSQVSESGLTWYGVFACVDEDLSGDQRGFGGEWKTNESSKEAAHRVSEDALDAWRCPGCPEGAMTGPSPGGLRGL